MALTADPRARYMRPRPAWLKTKPRWLPACTDIDSDSVWHFQARARSPIMN